FTCEPDFSHCPFNTGVFELVTVTITSAFRTASSAGIAVAPISCANRFACSMVGLQTRICSLPAQINRRSEPDDLLSASAFLQHGLVSTRPLLDSNTI